MGRPGPGLLGAMETFMESLNRLKDAHDSEVQALQNKLLELNSERCRDAQRVEELCAKNHQLREQQKSLKENVRVLENRLRAGLCDRCMVTQELARKRRQEFESSLLQSLRHVFILTNELNRLQGENEALKEEVKRLRGLRPKSQCREGTSDPPSPLLLPSPGTRKAVTEKLPGAHEEPEDNHPGKPTGYKTPPVAKISPGASLPESRTLDTSPQRISNQLHGTIAVVRPGSRACSTDRGSAGGTPPLPPARSSPPSPPYAHSLSLDSVLRASRPSAMACQPLKHSLQADNLCLLNRRLPLHLRSPHSSPQGPAIGPGSPQPQGLKARETEAWVEPTGLLGLPGALVDLQDPRLEGALHLLLAQQLRAQGRASSARQKGPTTLGETPPSPPAGSDSEAEVTRADLTGGQHPWPTGPGGPPGTEVTTAQDCVPDKPLDLSEWGRGRDAPRPSGQPGSLSPPAACAPSPKPPQGVESPAQSGPWGLSHDSKGARVPGLEDALTLLDPTHTVPGPYRSLPSPSRMGDEVSGRPEPHPCPQRPDADGRPELSKAEAQQQESDEVDEPGTPDSEVALSSEEAGSAQRTPGDRPRCFCTKEQGLQWKRKQASDLRGKASKKLSQGRRNPGEPPMVGPGSPGDPEDSSPSPSSSSWEET
ncbi:RBBP8 N-terminal-like protein [Manis pentadactyla]|uniref:RBBP8 N-terminal-like protein n=1 Tax=Manis pentadactyla TaxID=143292 RepID=UPI00255CCAE5|nr:RBBP8 N-terminal-like protein [Manis pentadactyla]